MLVNMDQVVKGVTAYYEQEFCQKASGIGQFGAYFMLPSISTIVRQKVEQFRDNPLASGLVNQDGLVDIDAVRDRAANAMSHVGSLDVMGFRLSAGDIDTLYEAIRRA